MLFGYVKKETVIALVEQEVETNRKMHDRYVGLAKAHQEHRQEGECYEKEYQRCKEAADEYFARYLGSKEILTQLNKL